MIGILLAAGEGTRLRSQINFKKNKCLLNLDNIPIIQNGINYLNSINTQYNIVIVGYDSKNVIDYVKFKLNNPKFIFQKKRNGIVGALKLVINELNDDFVLVLGDEKIHNCNLQGAIDYFYLHKYDAICGVTYGSKDEITKNYTIYTNEFNQVTSIIEKPLYNQIENNYIGTGICIFSKDTIKFLKDTPFNTQRNQYELADFLNLIIKNKCSIGFFLIGDKIINLNTPLDLNRKDG